MRPSLLARTLALAALGLAAGAHADPGSGVIPNPFVNGHFGTIRIEPDTAKVGKWGLAMKTLDATDMSVDKLAILPGGYSGWHAHPGPVFVTVTQGSVVFYDGGDPICPKRTYTTGESFIETTNATHYVKNASGSAPAEYVAVAIKPENYLGLAFRLDRPKPTNCTL